MLWFLPVVNRGYETTNLCSVGIGVKTDLFIEKLPVLQLSLKVQEYHSTAFVWSKESVGPGRIEGKRETGFIF